MIDTMKKSGYLPPPTDRTDTTPSWALGAWTSVRMASLLCDTPTETILDLIAAGTVRSERRAGELVLSIEDLVAAVIPTELTLDLVRWLDTPEAP